MKYNPGLDTKSGNWLNLHRNENIFLDEQVVKGIILEVVEENSVNRYPDPNSMDLKMKLAEMHEVSPDNIFIGNGADEVLESLFFFFRKRFTEVNLPRISFKMYEALTAKYEYNVNHFGNLPVLAPVINKEEVVRNKGLFFIDSPCSLTGLEIDRGILNELIESKGNLVVWDNVHGDYTNSIIKGAKDNLIVLRNFKFYGIAGLRIGYCIASKEIVAGLNHYRQPFNVNSVAQAAAIKCLERQDYFKSILPEVVECRSVFEKYLKELGFALSDSLTNFVLVKHENVSSEIIFEKLSHQKIATRHYASDPILKDYLRIAVPPRAEMKRVVDALKEVVID